MSTQNAILTVLRMEVAAALRKARALPVGADRNELRQLALGLRWLERKGSSEAQNRVASRFIEANKIRSSE